MKLPLGSADVHPDDGHERTLVLGKNLLIWRKFLWTVFTWCWSKRWYCCCRVSTPSPPTAPCSATASSTLSLSCVFFSFLVDRLPAVGIWVLVVTTLVVTWVPITKSDTENSLNINTKQEFALKILTCYNPKVGHSLRVQSSPYDASSFRSDSPGQCHVKGCIQATWVECSEKSSWWR